MTTHYSSHSRQRGGRSSHGGAQHSRGGHFSRGGRPQHYGYAPRRSRQAPKTRGIDVSRFINKEVDTVEAAPYITAHHFADFEMDARIKHNIARQRLRDPDAHPRPGHSRTFSRAATSSASPTPAPAKRALFSFRSSTKWSETASSACSSWCRRASSRCR